MLITDPPESYCVSRCGNIKCKINRFHHPQHGRGFSTANFSNRCGKYSPPKKLKL